MPRINGKQVAPPRGIPTWPPPYGTAWYGCSMDFAEVIEPIIEARNALLDGHDGAIKQIGELAARNLGRPADAFIRRLHDVRKGKTRSVNAEVMDTVFEILDMDLHKDTDIPIFPCNMIAARDQVSIHIENTEGRVPSAIEVEPLARKLYNFGLGYIADQYKTPFDDDFAEVLTAYMSVARSRMTFSVYEREPLELLEVAA